MATHHKAEAFSKHFGYGHTFGMQINILRKTIPAAPPGCRPPFPGATIILLVINGDIITDLSFGAMVHFHEESEAEMTSPFVSLSSAFHIQRVC